MAVVARMRETPLGDGWPARLYEAIRAELSKPPPPKTKTIPVWRVEWVDGGTMNAVPHSTAEGAEYWRNSVAAHPANTCVRIVEGEMEVPA